MKSESLRVDVRDHVATVTMCRPEVHNAFNDEMMTDMAGAFRELGGRADVRVIVLAGEGKSFSAGADVNWMKRMVGYTFEENVADARVLSGLLRAIRECPKAVIARVHGAAYGGGVGLTAACDMAAVVRAAGFCLSEVKLGIVPAVISPFVMEKIGAGAMRRYAVTAERFDADEARRIGLVSEVFETEVAMDAWIASVAAAVAKNGPEAVAACKRVISDVGGRDWNVSEGLTTQRIAERRVSEEGQEGLRAFLEKRAPGWTGGNTQ